MYECIKPTQYIREHKNDFLILRKDRFFIRTCYGGRAEITKETFDKLKKKGMKVK